MCIQIELVRDNVLVTELHTYTAHKMIYYQRRINTLNATDIGPELLNCILFGLRMRWYKHIKWCMYALGGFCVIVQVEVCEYRKTMPPKHGGKRRHARRIHKLAHTIGLLHEFTISRHFYFCYTPYRSTPVHTCRVPAWACRCTAHCILYTRYLIIRLNHLGPESLRAGELVSSYCYRYYGTHSF